jgi:sigma-B regulation protein RsbU (phosphoserine phosphatase)
MRVGAGEDRAGVSVVADAVAQSLGVEPAAAAAALASQPIPRGALARDGLAIAALTLDGGTPALAVWLLVRTEGAARKSLVLSALLRQDRRAASFRRSSLYTLALVDGVGHLLAHSDVGRIARESTFDDAAGLAAVLATGLAKGVLEAQNGSVIRAYRKLGVLDLMVLAEIPRARAFVATRRLLEKTAFFAALVLACAMLIGIGFARRLTAALSRLALATRRIARGDFSFDGEAPIGARDEVGALSRAFRDMAGEIRRLLAETAAKARMERELETAQLVQENFFPERNLRLGPLEIAAFFRPATECGGDFWGTMRRGDVAYLMIGDATGHGVPAALITAAAHACTTTLEHLGATGKVQLTPAFVAGCLDAAVARAGRGRVQMSFLVLAMDLTNGRVSYVNAAHAMPVVVRRGAGGSGETLDALAAAPVSLLGDAERRTFVEHEDRLAPGDMLVLYTDGLFDCVDRAGEAWGERRLLRAIRGAAKADAGTPAATLADELVRRVEAHVGAAPLEDDMTLVVASWDRAATALPQAS